MKANEFVKKYGLDHTRAVIHGASERFKYLDCENLNYSNEDSKIRVTVATLKRLVESHELVESFNGLENAKQFLDENIECSDSKKLKQAIADVEACQ